MPISNGVTIEIIRAVPGGHDEYGDATPTEDEPDEPLTIDNCAVAPRVSDDVTDRGREGVIVGLNVYAPPGSDIRHTDQVRIADVLYDIDGPPGEWTNPYTARRCGVVAALTRAEG